MSHNNSTDSVSDNLRHIALQQIADRCKTDLYYLCKYILGYSLMTEQAHSDLCLYTTSLLGGVVTGGGVGGGVESVDSLPGGTTPVTAPHSTQKLQSAALPPMINPSPDTEKNNTDILDVQEEQEDKPIENSLYNPAISDTNNDLVVQDTEGDAPLVVKLPTPGTLEELQKQVDEEPEQLTHKAEDSFDPKKNFLLLLMPRGSFKSSVVTVGFSIQYILNNPDARILIDSETYSKCVAFMREIRGHLEGNDKLREVFKFIYGVYPNEKKDEKWADGEFTLSCRKRQRKEPTFSAGGIGTTKTGMHYDLIIGDDLVSENNVTNKEQIDKVIDHYKLALSLLDPGSPLIIIGTRWDYNDLYQYILDNEAYRFNVLVRSATLDGTPNLDKNNLFFPERLTKKFLEDTKKSQGSYIFSCQYLNSPVDNESATFKASWIQRVEWDLVKDKPINWYLSIDPSFEGPESDYVAFVLAGMDYQHELYVRYILRAKMTYGKIIEALFDIYNRYQPKTVILETISHQKSLQYMLNDEMKRRGVWLPLREITSRQNSKEERVRGLAPFYEYGHVYHIRGAHQIDDLEYELIHFPLGKHDDVVDAFSTILEFATPPSGKRVMVDDDKKKRYDIFTKPRSPVTGI